LLHSVYSHPSIDKIRGSPNGVLKAIDDYGRTQKYLMNVGDDKGKIVANLIAEHKPLVMVELGGYVGYDHLRPKKLVPMQGLMPTQILLYTVWRSRSKSWWKTILQFGEKSRIRGCHHVSCGSGRLE